VNANGSINILDLSQVQNNLGSSAACGALGRVTALGYSYAWVAELVGRSQVGR